MWVNVWQKLLCFITIRKRELVRNSSMEDVGETLTNSALWKPAQPSAANKHEAEIMKVRFFN